VSLATTLTALLVTLLLGCATQRTFNAEVILSMPVGGACVSDALKAEPDVTEVIPTDEAGFAFLLKQPGKERKDWPAFGLTQGVDAHGATMLLLTTQYEAGLFESDTETRSARTQAILGAVTKACTGREPTWGVTRPCGAGEPHILCARGE
jgi:hypothetical protein